MPYDQEQVFSALVKANTIRRERARIKREVHAGTVSVVDVLVGKPYVCDSMTIYELLHCQRGWGRKRTVKVLSRVPMRESRELALVTERECVVLCELLSERN